MLEMLGKRVFALEDTLQKALDKVDKQDNQIKQLAHAQLICGCRNDQAARISGQKPNNAGVHLLLELLLSPKKKQKPNYYSKIKETPPTTKATAPPTTTRQTNTTPAYDIGGFGGVVEQEIQVTTTQAPVTPDAGSDAVCIEHNIDMVKQSEWKNNGEETYTFNGDIIADLPASVGAFSVLLIKFTKPITKIDVWDAEASPSDRDGLFWTFSPKYRDKYEENAGKTWKFNFMGTSSAEGTEGSGLFCDQFPKHGQFGEISDEAEIIESMTTNFKRLPYDGSICRISTSQSGEYPTNPK